MKQLGQDELDGLLSSINTEDTEGETPLHAAAGGGNIELAESLISAGADINARDNEGRTPLHAAVGVRNIETDKSSGFTGTDAAAAERVLSEDEIERLLTAIYAAEHPGSIEIVKALVSAGADITATDKKGRTPFCQAVEEGKIEAAQFLISKEADGGNDTAVYITYIERGLAFYFKKDYDSAIAEYTRAIETAGTLNAYYCRFLAYSEKADINNQNDRVNAFADFLQCVALAKIKEADAPAPGCGTKIVKG